MRKLRRPPNAAANTIKRIDKLFLPYKNNMVILISIHHKYVEKIKQGKKKYEFRRKYPLKEKSLALIYTPRPIKNINFWILFDSPIKGDIKKLIEISGYKDKEKQSLVEYFKGLGEGFAIPIIKFGEINPPVTLKEMTQYKIKPPQHITYLEKHQTFLKMVAQRSHIFSTLYFKRDK